MKIWLFLALVFFSFSSFGRTNDSLKFKLQVAKSEREKASIYDDASKTAWENGNFNKSIYFANKGLKYCNTPSFNTVKASLLNNLGIANDYLGDYSASLTAYFKALKIQEKLNDPEMEAYILSNIGLIYSNQERAEKALYYHEKSLSIRKKIGFSPGISASLNNIAIIYEMQKKHQKAIENYKQCIRIDDSIGDVKGLADDYNNISLVYMKLQVFDTAEYYMNKALQIRLKLEDRMGIAQCYTNLGTLRSIQKRFVEAKNFFLKAIPLSQEIGSKEILRYTYLNLVEVADSLKDPSLAYNYYRLYIQYRDSLDNVENVRLQTETELNYNFEKKTERTKILQEKKEEKNRLILYSVTIALVLIVFFSMLLFRRWKIAQHQRKIIEEKSSLLEIKNEEILASITYAKRIQTAILPSLELREELLPKHFISYFPKDIVAGDFYWLEKNNDWTFFAVADCTGHGVPGALMSVVCNNALNRAVREYNLTLPGEILTKTRELIVSELAKNDQSVSDGMDISLCSYHRSSKDLYWAGANNPIWIFRRETDAIEEIKGDKQPIGKYSTNKPFVTHEISIVKGDRLFLFTDGYADQFGGEFGKKIKTKNVKSLILKHSKLELTHQQNELNAFFESWKQNFEQVDDVCVMGIEW